MMYLFGEQLDIDRATSPDEIQWQNFNLSFSELQSRNLVSILLSVTYILFCILFMMFSSEIIFLVSSTIPALECEDIEVSKEEAYLDQLGE